jgi:hypothetical protein
MAKTVRMIEQWEAAPFGVVQRTYVVKRGKWKWLFTKIFPWKRPEGGKRDG